MGRIGQLTTGAGVVTVIAGQAQLEEFLLIGDVDTTNPLTAIQIEVAGQTVLNINSAALITGFMKWAMELTASTVGLMLKVATGQIVASTTYRLTNGGATTPNIFAFSDNKTGIPIEVASKTINPSSFETFEKFSVLLLETPANVAYADITFRDGHQSQLTIEEIDALFALKNQSEANGRLGTVSVINNTDQTIRRVKIYTTASALTVLQAKLPDAAFQALK